MMCRSRTLAVALAGALGAGGCGDIVAVSTLGDAGTFTEPAVIAHHGDAGYIRAPGTVDRGNTFEVQFRTFGGGCIHAMANSPMHVSGYELVIRPHHRRSRGQICNKDLELFENRVTVRIMQRGRFLIRVIGRQQGRNIQGHDAPVELTRWVEVR